MTKKTVQLDDQQLETVTGGGFTPQFKGGVSVAIGDVDGDGTSAFELEPVRVTSYQLGSSGD